NLTSYFLACRAALRVMRPQKFGRIVLFSSMAARTGGVNTAHYAASKGGILGLARSLAIESAAANIRVNTVSPVITDTPMPRAVLTADEMESRKSRIPLGRIGSTADMADACLFLLSNDSSYVLGQDLRVNGGSTLW
ncbi:MAG: SDR family NAD(P)-dependent oxidoreductase, partial [Candidatus Binatia bacterium]